MKDIGLVGLGLVGQALAQRLLAAGFVVHGFDLREDAQKALVAAGGRAASVAEIGERCECVVLAVFDSLSLIHISEPTRPY